MVEDQARGQSPRRGHQERIPRPGGSTGAVPLRSRGEGSRSGPMVQEQAVQARRQSPCSDRVRPRAPSVLLDLENYPSFEKKIKHKNQHHDTARKGFCELEIPKHFATVNGIEKHSPLKFVTRSLIEGGASTGRPPYLEMRFRNPDANNGNFVIRYGWLEFSSYHMIKKNWRLRFTLTTPGQLYVQRLKRINGVLTPVRL